MKLFYSGDCLRLLRLSRISQRRPESLGSVTLAASPRQNSKCKHTGMCFSSAKKTDRPLFEKWKTTRHLGPVATSNSVLRYYSSGEKENFDKDAIVQEFLKDIKGDFENEFKSCVKGEGEEYARQNELEEKKLEINGDKITDKKNYYCEPLVVPSLNLISESNEEIANRDVSSYSSSSVDGSEKLLTDDDEEDDIEDFIDYGYTVEDEDDDIDIQLYTPPIELKRGTTGVFDIEDLVTVLKDENGIDICVIDVPKTKNYVDYMVVVSGKSARHIKSIAQNIRWLYKQKKHKSDPFIKIEGLNTNNWLAMDLGNIALHIFLPQLREKYDLETLWTVGDIYDDKNLEYEDPYAMKEKPLQETSEELMQDKEESSGSPEVKVEDNSQIQNLSNKN